MPDCFQYGSRPVLGDDQQSLLPGMVQSFRQCNKHTKLNLDFDLLKDDQLYREKLQEELSKSQDTLRTSLINSGLFNSKKISLIE